MTPAHKRRAFLVPPDSSFVVAAENVYDLVGNHLLDCFTRWFQILAWIEIGRMLCKMFANRSRHCKAQIRVDIDFAYRTFSSLYEAVLPERPVRPACLRRIC